MHRKTFAVSLLALAAGDDLGVQLLHSVLVGLQALRAQRVVDAIVHAIAGRGDVWIEDRESGIKNKANEAIYTFVAVDETGRPIPVPPIVPETDLEKERFAAALRRKQLSLVLAGKMKPSEATELKALFIE